MEVYLKTVLVLTAGILSISFSAIFIRFCNDVPPVTIAAYRLIIASVILISIAAFKKTSLKDIGKKEILLSILSAIFLSLHLLSWITSLKLTSITSSVVLVTTNPIFVAVFSYIIFKEKQPKELIIGIILSVLGSCVLAIGDGGISSLGIANKEALIGDILALIGAIMASGYLITGSIMREKMDTFKYILIVYPVTAVLLSIFLLFGDFKLTGFKATSWLNIFLLGTVSQLIGHTAFNWALKHLKTSMVAISILGEPIGASILAFLFFKETISLTQFLGIICIFTAITIGSKKGKKQNLSVV